LAPFGACTTASGRCSASVASRCVHVVVFTRGVVVLYSFVVSSCCIYSWCRGVVFTRGVVVLCSLVVSCRVLTLESNQLEGAIPFSIGSLASLANLTVDHNRVSDLPVSILSLAALRCGLMIDRVAAPLQPHFLPSLMSLVAYLACDRTLSLCNNSFNGPLPAFLSNATWITYAGLSCRSCWARCVTVRVVSSTGRSGTACRRAG
jgi:hypothetical protein